MNFGILLTVLRREVTDLLRDRRTLFSMVVLPTIVFPVLFAVIGRFTSDAGKKAEAEARTVAVPSAGLPDAFAAALESSGLKLIPLPDVNQAVADKVTSAGFRLKENGRDAIIVVDRTRQASSIAAQKVRTALTAYQQSLVVQSLRAANLGPEILKPFAIDSENVADERKMGGFVLGSILGYVVILLMFSGGMYPAVDMTAGEKERKTLEALLSTPARRTEIVLGKILACVTATYLTALLTTGSLFWSITSKNLPLDGMDKYLGNLSLDGQTIALVLLTLLPVALMAGSLMVAIATAARSFKEAQSYLTPLIMLVIFPSLLGGLPGMELSPALSLIPVFNASQILKSILQGDLNPTLLAITNGANLVYAAICFVLAVRTFNNESVLFRS
ncbi:MAG: ABC transporter permease [Bryobacter sp.]